MADRGETLLEVDSLVSGYGNKQVLADVSLRVARGEIVAIIGHNGAGKTTLLKAVFGMIRVWQGDVQYNGHAIENAPPRRLIRGGLTYVPQGNRVFGDLTVSENLHVAGTALPNRRARRAGIECALADYPVLRARLKQRAATLSGGEKQMLALTMSLVLSPQMILMDEPSLGLAPPLVIGALNRIHALARERGVTILIVEQKVRDVLKIAQRVYVLRSGQVSYTGSAESLRDEATLRMAYL